MAKNSGSTRAKNSRTASESRTVNMVSAFGAEYEFPKDGKEKILSWLEKNGFKGEDLEWIPDNASFEGNMSILNKNSKDRPYWFNELDSDARDVIIKGIKSLSNKK